MKKPVVLLLVFLCAFGCQKKETETVEPVIEETLAIEDLYSKVYYISPKLNPEDCTAFNDGCDCCDGKIVFLANGTFISNFYCMPNESYNTGTFRIENKRLLLDYDDREAVYGPSKDDFSEEEESTLRLDTVSNGVISLDIIKCNDRYVLSGKDEYYAEDKKTSFATTISEYKETGVWELLEMKN